MTDARETVERVEALLAKATPGPWKVFTPRDGGGGAVVQRALVNQQGGRTADWPAVCNCPTLPNAANAKLIVALVNAAPELLTAAREVEALRAEVARLREAAQAVVRDAEDLGILDGLDPDGDPLDTLVMRARPLHDLRAALGDAG